MPWTAIDVIVSSNFCNVKSCPVRRYMYGLLLVYTKSHLYSSSVIIVMYAVLCFIMFHYTALKRHLTVYVLLIVKNSYWMYKIVHTNTLCLARLGKVNMRYSVCYCCRSTHISRPNNFSWEISRYVLTEWLIRYCYVHQHFKYCSLYARLIYRTEYQPFK